MSFCNGTGK
ncbi:hypothetical protein LINGRAHAP2_LOCUS25954 [Linum grandiflorum]